ncbi:YmL10 [Clarireedia jacksonii]
MPLRLSALSAICRSAPIASTPLAAFLAPLLQARNASILASLSDNPGAYNKRIRRGRGPSSGKGKTSGRGHKGQKQHGKVPARFQGGQTPQEIVQGKRGFDNQFTDDTTPVNLNRIQSWIDQGRLDPTQPITLKELAKSRCLHGVKDGGVKLLAKGKEDLKATINILVSRASAAAIEAVEAHGGKVTTRYYSATSIRRVIGGESMSSFHPLSSADASSTTPPVLDVALPKSPTPTYRLPDPTSRKAIEYYRDAAHRGYLSHTVAEGEGPSLFFKPPREGKFHKKSKKTGTAAAARENRLW